MKRTLTPLVILAALTAPAAAQALPRPMAPDEMRRAAPDLARQTDRLLFGDVWQRDDLTPRDRSLVTIAILVASNQAGPLNSHIGIGMANGLKAEEISAAITHLAFYSGWPNGVAAARVADQYFTAHGLAVAPTQRGTLPRPANDAARAAGVRAQVAPVAPGLADDTNRVLFDAIWRDPALTPRDRSLVTIAALIAGGAADQMPFHVRKGMENGLTRVELGGIVTHAAYYAGWPKAFSAVGVLRAVVADDALPDDAQAKAKPLTVRRAGSDAQPGPPTHFTGRVVVDTRFAGDGASRLSGARVTFAPGARTHWHSHPLGQLLIIVDGRGLVQSDGGAVERLGPGDTVWTPAGVRHWHGAAPDTAMTHFAVLEQQDGQSVTWQEPVTDAQYAAGTIDRKR